MQNLNQSFILSKEESFTHLDEESKLSVIETVEFKLFLKQSKIHKIKEQYDINSISNNSIYKYYKSVLDKDNKIKPVFKEDGLILKLAKS